MKTIITAWPVDKALQIKLGIYSNSEVRSTSIGKTIRELIKNGYTDVSSYVENFQDDVTKVDIVKWHIHCRKLSHT